MNNHSDDPRGVSMNSHSDKPAPPRTRRSPDNGGTRPRRKRGPRRGRGGGGRFGRIIYWGCVLGLWALIAVIGVAVWVGAHLPAIQSLEIPKRPPSIQIVDVQGHPLATRGDL